VVGRWDFAGTEVSTVFWGFDYQSAAARHCCSVADATNTGGTIRAGPRLGTGKCALSSAWGWRRSRQ